VGPEAGVVPVDGVGPEDSMGSPLEKDQQITWEAPRH